ncbi:MAG: AMP-binding protein [Myxococcales bacterium]|nr:AMP-binding protein [Myxococcales bacterium]
MTTVAKRAFGADDELATGVIDRHACVPGAPDAHSSEFGEAWSRKLWLIRDKYPGVVGPICQIGTRFAIPIACPRGARSARFGLWLRELDHQGQLVRVIASYLAAVPHLLIEVQESHTDVLEVVVSNDTTLSGLDQFLNDLEFISEVLTHGRSDLLLQHLTGRPPPDEMPSVEDYEMSETRVSANLEVDAVISVLFQPLDLASLARLDASLLAYNNEDAGAVGQVLGRLLQPFVLDSTEIPLGRKAVRVDHICLPGLLLADTREQEEAVLTPAFRLATKPDRHRVALCRNTVQCLGTSRPGFLDPSRVCDGSSTAILLLRRVLDEVVKSGGLADHGLTIELLGTDEPTEAAFRALSAWPRTERVGSVASEVTPPVDVIVLFPTTRSNALDVRVDSVIVDLFGTCGTRSVPDVLLKNVVYVSGASVWLDGMPVISTPPFALDRVEPALLEALLRELYAASSTDGGPSLQTNDFVALQDDHHVEVRGVRGFWGEIGRAEWAAFHSRRRGELTRYRPSELVTAANPPLASLPDKTMNVCEYVFSESHIRSGLSLIDPQSCQSVTYAELQRMASTCAQRFRALGLRVGDVVALAAPDGISTVAVMLGCFMGGGVFAPLNYFASAANFDAMLNAAKPGLVLYDPAIDARHLSALKDMRHAELASFLRPDAPDDADGEAAPVPLSPEAAAVMLFTSGSTGTPKAVIHSHGDFIACSRNYSPYIVELGRNDRVYTPSPIFFAYGLNNVMLSLSAGATHVIAAPRDGGVAVTEVLAENEVTVLFTVPAVYKLILRNSDRGMRFPKLRLCVSAGEKLPSKLYREVRRFFGVNVLDGIGCTEAISTFISNRQSYVTPACTGVVIPGFAVKLVNQRGELCQVGEIGVLWVQGEALARCYSNDPDLTKKHFVGGWFNTQDMFYMDAEYRFYSMGRAGSVIKINSCWFSPDIMEAVLQSHPAVKDCAVCTVTDDYGLPRPKAFVVIGNREGYDDDLDRLWAELRALSKDKLGKDHYPHKFAAIGALPRTTSGKLIRSELLKLA